MANAKPKRRRTTKRGPGKLTAKQDEVKKLLDSGQTIVEVAELMDTTPGAIKAQISRMKKIGVKIATSGSAQQAARANRSPAVVDEAPPEMSVEDHLGIELARVDDRLTTVGEMLRTLGKEQDELTDRKGRLEAARAELAPGGRPALAVVA